MTVVRTEGTHSVASRGLLVGGPELKHPLDTSLPRTPSIRMTYMDGLKVT